MEIYNIMGVSQDKCTNNYAYRLKVEFERIGINTVARHLDVHRNTVANWTKLGNIPLDKLGDCAAIGINISYVLTGLKESEFETRLQDLKQATESVMQVASERPEPPDLMQLAPVRDFAVNANLNNDQIRQILILIESASKIYGYSKPLDIKLLTLSIELAEGYMDLTQVNFNNSQKAQLVAGIYERHSANSSPSVDSQQPSAEIINLIDRIREKENGGVVVSRNPTGTGKN